MSSNQFHSGLFLPFLPQSMEAMFEWEDEDEDKEDKVVSSLNSRTFMCNIVVCCTKFTKTSIFPSALSGVRAQGLH